MITSQIEASGIPANVFNGFRVVGPKDKLLLYANIEKCLGGRLMRLNKFPLN